MLAPQDWGGRNRGGPGGPVCLPDFGTTPCNYSRPGCRDVTIGMRQVDDIASGDEGLSLAEPQRCFCLERVVIPRNIGVFFNVLSFKIGDLEQLSGDGPVPALVWAEDAESVVTYGDCLTPGINISMRVQNTDTLAHTFNAALIGSSRGP
jgi:hypothetical protein